MSTAAAVLTRRPPDRLLQVFLVVSLLVHGWLLVWLARIAEGPDPAYIEVELRDSPRPAGREIPVPPHRPRPAPARPVQTVMPMRPMPLPAPVTPPPAPAAVRPEAVAAIAAPAAPVTGGVEAIPWSPPPAGPAGAGVDAVTARDYLDMVRRRVESSKQYPAAARRRQLEGRVVVRFVIDPDGGISDVVVVKRARFSVLDEAAVAAVSAAAPFPRPPAHLFSGPLPLEIGIVFELM